MVLLTPLIITLLLAKLQKKHKNIHRYIFQTIFQMKVVVQYLLQPTDKEEIADSYPLSTLARLLAQNNTV